MPAPETPDSQPTFGAQAFVCPFCRVFAHQLWGFPSKRLNIGSDYGSGEDFAIARCARCGRFTIWQDKELIHPRSYSSSPEANADLDDDIRRDYDEARAIIAASPRGAAALLRLAIQKLCKQLGEKGKNINTDIAALGKKGLPATIQQALDVVRVVGNDAVHPGQLDLRDDRATVNQLFQLVNLIAEVMISQPKAVRALYESVVPDEQRKAIEQRDTPPA